MIAFRYATFLLSLSLLEPLQAVQVLGTTGNTTAPPDDPGFANVGSLNGASAVYLGNRWVLTASHVGPGTVTFGGAPYAGIGPVTQLSNQSTPGMTLNTDLILFQIGADPGLPALSIASAAPVLGDDVVMIGNGVNRGSTRSYFTVVQGPGNGDDIWTSVGGPGPGVVTVFLPYSGNAVRWGTNDVEGINLDVNSGSGTVRSFGTIYNDDLAGRPNEAQGVLGDSGSAVFHKVGANWELSGMTHAVGTLSGFDNIPGGSSSAVVNNSITVMADLSFYRTQILAVIPEPGSASLAAVAALGLLRRRRA
jgi:hypothetical protein